MALIAISAAVNARPPADLQAKLDRFVAGSGGGAAAAWIDADGTVFFQAGVFSARDPRPITPDTRFEIGSITKVFNAVLLAESERAGKVSRHDPAAKYLLPADDPDQPKLAPITLLALATHTSGLPRLPSNFGTAPDSDPYATYDAAMLRAALRTDGARAKPTDRVAYSNFGGALLGQALAAAWGGAYAEVLQAHVLDPLGMKATTLGLAGMAAVADLAPAHAGGEIVPNWNFAAFAPAGALRSSARDMARFVAAYLEPKTGPLAVAMSATLEPQVATETTGGHIGLGVFLTDDGFAWHNGATAGSHAFFGFNRQRGSGIVILANFQKASEPLGFELLGAKAQIPRSAAVKNATQYVGRYSLSPAFAIDITEAHGSLRARATGQPAFALRETGPDRFAVIDVPAEVSFERDNNGQVSALVLHQNGVEQRGARSELPPAPREISLPVETLREYVGHYALAPTFVLTVTEANGALFAQATGQPKAPVFASAKDEFFYKVVDAQLSFARDSEGKVTGLTLHQAGRDLPGKRAP